MVNVSKVGIVGAFLITLDCHRDSRGFFIETFQRERYKEFGIAGEFVQDNRSRSEKNVLRGMHYQITHPQGHLVYVTSGAAFDVGLDLRKDSPTFKHWIGVTLSSEGHQQLYLPPGVAHGFCALTEEVEIYYKCTDYYYSGDEGGILWNDPDIGIQWPVQDPLIKGSDAQFLPLKDTAEDKLPQIGA